MTEHNRTGLDWENIRVFLALGRHGSLSAAARALSITHATVSRRVSSLEAALGEKLVERRPDGYVLTEAGTRALSLASDMERSSAILGRRGADDRPKGMVRVNAPPSLTHGFLVPRLAGLAVMHAGLDIDLSSEFRNASLERRETDVALRLGRPKDGDVIARHLIGLSFGFYASALWCRRIEQGAPPEFIGYDEANAYIPEAVWLSRHFARARVAFRVNNQLSQASAAKANAGIALLPHFIGRAFAGIRSCMLQPEPPSREVWLIIRRQDRTDLPITTVVGYLEQMFASERAVFEEPSTEPPVDQTQ